MKKLNRKGFTIVELVIVVAVIAVLASALIPTFVGLVKKANESKDTQLVKNLNTALAIDLEDNKTMTDALADAAAAGYDLTKIEAAATDNKILWDSVNNLFCYLKGEKIEYIPEYTPEKEVAAVDYWVISDEVDTTYSTYYIGEETDITTSKGFDAGTTALNTVKYKNDGAAQSVVIRTNGGELAIDAPSDTVYHHGNADSVDVIEINTASYHVFGKVGFFKMQKGHAVIETGAYVEVVYKTTADSTITAEENSVVNNAFASDAANVANGSNDLVFTVTDTTEESLKTEAKKDLELHIMLEAGCVAKSGGKYYKTIAEALGVGYVVYVIADTDEKINLPENKVVIVENGVNYTGTVAGLKVEIDADKQAYAATLEKALQYLTTFSPETKEVTVKLLEDIVTKKQIATPHGVKLTLDLNGKTVTSQYSLKLFLIRDDFDLCSGVEGAKVELGKGGFIQVSSDYTDSVVNISDVVINRAAGASTDLVLNYGTLNIENTTINAVDVTSTGQLFTTYGDLTLGENTVVNVTERLGTSIINAHGSSKVTVNGATINVKTFRVNGGGFFSLANACSLDIKNTKLTVGLDETYGSYFVNNNVTAKTVTIENMTTNIVGGTSGATYTVDATTATWSKN